MGNHPQENGQGLQRILRAARCSAQGLAAAWRHESAFRQELLLALPLAPVGWWLGQTLSEKLLLIGCLFLVLIAELVNSAIEAVVDRIGSDYHELSGRAKDIGSAAVFMALVFTGFCYLAIAISRFVL